MGHRWYDPAIGRFLSQDPFPADLTDPQSLNRYVYVKNNPLIYTDPLGLWYLDFNFSADDGAGVTCGIQINSSGIYPYFGRGAFTPGIGGSAMYSGGDPTPGWNKGIQYQFGAAGQNGYGADGGHFSEIGGGGPGGVSYTEYYVWGPWKPW